MGFVRLPIIPRTTRPSVAGTPVWYAEATMARTQLDISITVPAGDSRKLIMLWGSDGGQFPTAVTFDPAGLAIPMIAIDGAFEQIGTLRIGAYYLDTPPSGARIVRIATANAVWSVASLKVYRDARAGAPQAASFQETGTSAAVTLDEGGALLDAFSESADLVLGEGLSDGNLTPLSGQTAGPEDVVNSSFLATSSNRTHSHNGAVVTGWTAASSADLLSAVVNVPFSTGQIAAGSAVPLFEWNLDEPGGTFLDAYGRANAAVVEGLVSGGHAPLFSGSGSSINMQGAQIIAEHHIDAQVASWSAEIYVQPRSWPAVGTNDSIFSKDSGLPVPGGFQVEVEDDGAIDFYIRDATGLAGTAIHVTSSTGDGELTLNTAHVIHLTYDHTTKTAEIYLNKNLLASKTDPNFAGLQNNSSAFSLFSRLGTSGNQIDGIGDRVTFFSGGLTAAEVGARPAPTTITDPLAPGAITAAADNAGNVPPSTTTDVDVLANDTGKTGPHYDIEIMSDPAGRLSVVNDQTANARIRITTPAAPSADVNESGAYRVREGTSPTFGNPSNQTTLTWRRPGTGGSATFPFVTDINPPVSHSGVANRPGYSSSDPRSASIIDPMSGIQIFRVGGNFGSPVFINGGQNSGLVFPHVLRNINSGTPQRCFNADGSLLLIDRYYSETGDPSNSCRSYLIDVTGTHGASAPWRIIRASSEPDLGDGVGIWQFWDPDNPLRMFVPRDDGQVDEWWPAGGEGHAVGEVNTIRGPISGFSGFTTGSGRHNLFTSYDGQYYVSQCRRNSDGMWGGMRINLITGALGPFVRSPDAGGAGSGSGDHPDRGSRGTSPNGLYTGFSFEKAYHRYFRIDTAAQVSESDSTGFSHADFTQVNGVQYAVGVRSSDPSIGLRTINVATGAIRTIANMAANNPMHVSCRGYKDVFETHGAAGGATSGLRYTMVCRSSPSGSTPRGIWGVRMGPNDTNVVRYICNHRGVRSSNRSEAHHQQSPDGLKVCFNSNWAEPGIATDGDQHPYVAVIPDAWHSPNNDGS